MNTDRHRYSASAFFAALRLRGAVLLLAAFCLLPSANGQRPTDYTRWVNPFIGTGGHGHTFPGSVLPFGMVQLSPDTRQANWDGSSGYHYSDDIIYGFSHTHLSGTGIPDGCDILFMPTLGEPQFFAKAGDKSINGYASKFSHASERAEPGYYSVKLDDDGILAEMTATKRVGLQRYTFPGSNDANIILDLKWRDTVLDSDLKFVSKNRIEGFRRSSSWAKDQVVYFVAEFSKPFAYGSTIKASENDPRVIDHKNIKAVFRFKTRPGEKILVKVAISSVSIEGARKNLADELPSWDFDKIRADARAAWNKELSKIEVSGGTDAQMTTFYTALYHTMIHPSLFDDVDGNYRGLDGKTHNIADDYRRDAEMQRNTGGIATARQRANTKSKIQNSKSDQYTVFSLWDTFRAAHPLYTIIDQKRTVDFINTFIRMYEHGGRLPVWELWGNETDTMIGYHAVSVIADAMAKGIKGFDYEKAYEAAKHSAELDRDGLAAYKRRGYISSEDDNESVSKTLEYAYDDWCIAKMAEIMGRRYEDFLLHTNKALQSGLPEKQYAADYEKYSTRARYFEDLFDPSTGFMRPKKNGGFVSPFAPNEVTFNYTEGNAWVYTFFAPQDISRLIELEGGNSRFAAKLDELFTTSDKLAGREQPDITGLIGQYAHGNEPSHHIAYLYDYVGQPWKTQKSVRQIMDEFYKPEPDGLIGNEDCGQMSAWYVLSASGIYEATPGSGVYAFGTPLFKEVKFHLENGKIFTIKAPNVSSNNIYIRSTRLNGQQYRNAYITHEAIMFGGTLEFDMVDAPVKDAFLEFPVSGIKTNFVATPLIDGSRSFHNSQKLALRTISSDSKIYYTLNGGQPSAASTPYNGPITINSNTTVKAIAVNSEGQISFPVEATFIRIPNDWTVKIDSKYSRQYTGGGDEGLIDGIRGSTSFASGEWQGYQGQDFTATIDLRKETEIHSVGGGFLQVARSWIWMPTRVEFGVSTDGVNFTKVADIKNDVPVEDMNPKIRDFRQDIAPTRARYVRVHAYNLGKIPEWHPGAGGDAYIFVDEILIN
jgi:putative alpha-1,2-mannosidase